MDYLRIFNEDIAFNVANPRYHSNVPDDEYGERRNGFGLRIRKKTIFVKQHQRLGKMAISIIYDIYKRLNYKLYLVQMVESFYIRMLNRGAEVIEPYDTL